MPPTTDPRHITAALRHQRAVLSPDKPYSIFARLGFPTPGHSTAFVATASSMGIVAVLDGNFVAVQHLPGIEEQIGKCASTYAGRFVG